MHRSQLTGTVAVVVPALLAACGVASVEGNPPPSAHATSDGSTVRAIDPDRPAPAAPVDGAITGGTVTVLSEQSVPFMSLDPSDSWYSATQSVLSGLLTRSLTQYVYDPGQDTMVLVPDIATDVGTPNADLTAWTFTIRDGVRYEDGTPVTADDVAYGIKRSFDRAAFPSGPPFSNQYLLNGDTYKGPYISGTSYPGISVDGSTLTIRAERSFPDMPYLVANPEMGPIPTRGSDPTTYAKHPLATGPYRVGDFRPGRSLTLVRNANWDPDTDPGRHAYPDRYRFEVAVPGDRIDARVLSRSQRAQTTISMDTRPTSEYRKAQQLGRLTAGTSPCTFFWLPDYRKITDIRVRQALGYAFPYKDNAELLRKLAGELRTAGTSILPPSFPGRLDYNPLTIKPGESDPDKARALLKEAGYAPGEFELKILYDPEYSIIADHRGVYERALRAGGFKVTLQSTPNHDEYLRERDDPNAPINVRTFGWCADWPTGGSWFPQLFQSGSDFDISFFAEPKIDAEMARISQLPLTEQAAAWGVLDMTIMTDYYPVIILGYTGVTMLHGSKIAGMNNDALYSTPTWKDTYVLH